MMFVRPRTALALSATLVASACSLCATHAHAALLASDAFDYNTSGTLGAQSSAGGGFSSGWTDDAGLTTASTDTVEAASLTAPTGYDPAPSGGSTSGSSGFLAYRGLAAAAQIDLGVDQDYYISFLAERNVGTRARSYSVLLQDSTASTVATISTSTGGAPGIGFGAGTVSGATAVGNGSTSLWVIKIAARATDPDQIFLEVYNEAEALDTAEPTASWDVTSNTDLNASVISQIGFAMGSGATFQLDELRIGESFEDVTGVPEPASALLALSGMLLLGTRRGVSRD